MLLQQFELDKQESAARQIGMASKTLSAATATVSVALADRGDLNWDPRPQSHLVTGLKSPETKDQASVLDFVSRKHLSDLIALAVSGVWSLGGGGGREGG